MPRIDASKLNLEETVVQVSRVSKVVKGGRRFSIRALVVVGESQPAAVHAVAHALNAALGSVGTTVEYTDSVEVDPVDQSASLRELVANMHAGDVALLIILDGNPAYTAPADVPFTAGLNHVETRVHLGFLEDETSAVCNWHIQPITVKSQPSTNRPAWI